MSVKSLFLSLTTFFGIAITMPAIANVHAPDQLISQEINRLDTLIQATQQSLETQKKLRDTILEYQKAYADYIKQPQNDDLLLRLVKSAHKTLKLIKEGHLKQTFDPAFIDELTVLAQPASKRGIPKS